MTATSPAIEMNRRLLADLKEQEAGQRTYLGGLTRQITAAGEHLTDLGEKIASTEEAITVLVRAQEEKDAHPPVMVNATTEANRAGLPRDAGL